MLFSFFFFNDTATTEIYTTHNTLSLHDALPISPSRAAVCGWISTHELQSTLERSEEHTSELQSLCVTSYAVFCLKKKKPRYEPASITNTPRIEKKTQTIHTS